LTKIPSCLWQICDSLSSGQASKINPACCSSINQVSDDCWPKMFPCHPFFPSLLKNFCAALSPDQPTGANSGSKLSVPSRYKCWPKMFPFNPFFPPLLKSSWAEVSGAAPTPD
ncbi:hypothetical protein CISIN_1g042067mg, partial [Citrus sinensis]